MRYLEAENPYILGVFDTGDTVTIDIYDLSDNSVVIDDGECSEIGSIGVFKYNFTETPAVLKYYFYIMTNTVINKYGIIVKGGFPDAINDKTTNLPADPADQSDVEDAITSAQSDIETAISNAHSTTDGKIDTIETNLTTEIDANEGKIDTAITNIGNLNDLSSSDVESACDSSLATYDPPTKIEMDAKIDALNNISSANVTTACTSSLNTYDAPTRTELASDKDEIIAEIDANETKIDNIVVLLTRALGLMQENHYLDITVYDDDGNLTSGRIRIYSVAGSVGTASNVVATYTITATYDDDGYLSTYKVVKS